MGWDGQKIRTLNEQRQAKLEAQAREQEQYQAELEAEDEEEQARQEAQPVSDPADVLLTDEARQRVYEEEKAKRESQEPPAPPEAPPQPPFDLRHVVSGVIVAVLMLLWLKEQLPARQDASPVPLPAAHRTEPEAQRLLVKVQLEFRSTETETGTIFHGETNLPDGTKIGAVLEKAGYKAQDFDIHVKEGIFSSAPFTHRGAPLAGEYGISIFTHFNNLWQSKAVLEKLKNYTGPLIQNGKLEVVRNITLGNNLSKQSRNKVEQMKQQELKEKQQLQTIWLASTELLRQGKSMESLRNSANMRQCMQGMRSLQPQVKVLRAQVESLPRKSNTVSLGAATAVLELCVSCVKNSALKSCAEAEVYLGQVYP